MAKSSSPPRDPTAVLHVPREAFPPQQAIDIGVTYAATRSDGRAITFRVVAANHETVVIDTNHPLAGQTLHVWVIVRMVREATEQEKVQGEILWEDTAGLTPPS